MDKKPVVYVIGAGVVGLSTALRVLETGLFDVAIFAEVFPTDDKTIKYTSCWAAAIHTSDGSGVFASSALEMETYAVFKDMLAADPDAPLMECTHRFYTEVLNPDVQATIDNFASRYPDKFRVLDSSEYPPATIEKILYGVEFSTIHIDVPHYLRYLFDKVVAAGGKGFRTKIPSLSALLGPHEDLNLEPVPSGNRLSARTPTPAAIINCTGLGALSLGDVLDTDMYPTRGEVLIVHAPWLRAGLAYMAADEHMPYIIPRKSGQVILGGTFQPNDWHPRSRPETVQLIKERGLQVCPELVSPEKRREKAEAGVDVDTSDIEVIEECVGLRPTRKGGIRVETTILEIAGHTVPVVHNYG
ncbi:D-amino-acid oxidase, partial [Mycena amicta]